MEVSQSKDRRRGRVVGRVAQLVEQCPFKAWVAGSSPAALTKFSKYLEDFGRVDFGHPRTPRRVSTQLGRRFALSISREISPERSYRKRLRFRCRHNLLGIDFAPPKGDNSVLVRCSSFSPGAPSQTVGPT